MAAWSQAAPRSLSARRPAGWWGPARLVLLAASALHRGAVCQAAGEVAGPDCETCWKEGDDGSGGERYHNGSRALSSLTYFMPTSAALYLEEAGGGWTKTCHPSLCTAATGVSVGISYSKVELRASLSLWSSDYGDARLNVVDGDMNTMDAQNGDCLAQFKDTRYVEGSWGSATGVPTTPSGNVLMAGSSIMFRMGGSYRLCYSANGTFGVSQADVSRVKIDVNGVFDTSPSCNSYSCLTHRRYECYLMKDAFNTEDGRYGLQTTCIVDYSYAGAGYFGPTGFGTWSSEWRVDGYNPYTGAVGTVTPWPCTSEPASFICRDGGACDAGNAYITPDPINSNRRYNIPATRPDLLGDADPAKAFSPRTVAACYCPARGGCTTNADYVQQVGVLHFYLSKVCHAKDTACTLDRNGVTSQYRFKIRVECPTDACSADDNNRMKLVAHSATNDRPSWDSLSTCGTMTHGIVAGVNVLPLTPYVPIDGSPGGDVNQPTAAASGGRRQDYKVFGGPFGFRFKLGPTGHEERNFHNAKAVDVCYCNGDCGNARSWFKVGAMRMTPTRLVSSATSRSSLPAQWAVEYVNQPGIIGLERPYADADVLGLQESALIKVVTDKEKTLSDDGCAWMGYSSQLVSGPSDPVAAAMNYIAKRQTQTPVDLKKLVFNTDSFVNTITVKQSGTIAVCYCGITVDNVCVDPGNWKLIAHLQIRGPKVNQRWLFSTNVVFRFSFEGYGLGPSDSLRIISSDGRCTDNNFNPNTAAYAYTSLQVKCPVPCNAVTPVNGNEIGDLPTAVLSADTWNCDRDNANCQDNDITAVTVVSATETEITFQHPPGFQDGDEITLRENIACDPADPVCTPEALQALKGIFDYADKDMNSAQAPETYMAPHRVTLTSNVYKVRLRVGWPSPAPRFIIVYGGARPEIGYIGRGGKWIHHSRAITREEILGAQERANLRVCWKYGGNGGKYVAEVGRITIRNPAPMEGDIMLSMSTTLVNKKAPMVLTFTTATGITGLRYENAVDSIRLKILFTKTDIVDIVYSDLAGADIPYNVPAEDDLPEASQAICGKLFLELWSNDMERGFPLPKGCYYKGYPQGNMREVFMVFEGKSGLRKDTTYQIVFNGIVKDPAVLDKDITVGPGGQYMELFPMDDISARPYEAIERGMVTFTSRPQVPGALLSDPKFRCVNGNCDGFKIVGGYNNLLEVKSGDSIIFELMGDPTAGRIQRNHIIRIFLWPLTQWKTTSSCTAECVTGGEVSFLCAPIQRCQGLPVVPGMGLNMLKITLPDPFQDLHGHFKIRLKVGGITIPSGGFFANHLAAQVTTDLDTKPHYVLSVGDYIWKEPNLGQTVAKVVSPEGGGNLLPFRGDQDNILYARLLLSSTIYARDDIGVDASFTITLPPGYRCLDTNDPNDATQGNPWQADTTLAAFGPDVPQGRGTPDDGSPTHGWTVNGNKCMFRPAHPNGIVYAGSSMVVKIHVNNPPTALQRSDLNNRWTLHMTNKGLHTVRQETQRYPFLSPLSKFYQTNNAVLGRLTEASCQPSTFAPSSRRAVEQELRFFFRTEQEVGAGGMIRVFAPQGFSFGAQCNASDLEAPYYATEANPADATLRLPGITACTTIGGAMRQADVSLSNILVGGRLFGFKLRVENPLGYDLAHATGWRIFTVDSSDYLVDGTASTVPFNPGDGTSWGVYSSRSLSVFIKIPPNDMKPFVMTRQRSRVTVLLEDIPSGDSGWMRFMAPAGYVWDFTDAEFAYDPAAAGTTVNAVTLHAPEPRDGSNTLVFRPMTFVSATTYAFTALVRVPDQAPTTATNSFFFELGYRASSTDARRAAAVVPAPPVRALKNARIDYTTTIIQKENTVQFQIETITTIPEGGGIEIVAPEDFIFDGYCELVPVRDPGAGAPPPLTCFSWVDRSRGPRGKPVVTLKAGAGGLAPGLHSFGIIVENPATTLINFDTGDTPCGTFICWSFETFTGPSTPTAMALGPLDYITYAQGFSIKNKMLEAQIPYLTEEQRRATGRDDRPVQPNSIIFAFKLDTDARSSGDLLLRGPYGYLFAEECLSGIAVSEGTVFGLGNRFPPEYAVWPPGVVVTNCRGQGADARLTLSMQGGAFLEGSGATGTALSYGALYLFRIQVTTNPLVTPTENRWLIEANGESSEAIEGFQLWAFTRTNIVPITTARDRTLAGAIRTQNPLRISLRPFNAITTGGQLRMEAPLGFQFVSLPSRECDVQLQELPYNLLGINYPGYVWPKSGLVCLVDKVDSRKAAVTLRDTRELRANLNYLLILTVYNPSTVYDPGPTAWQLSSYNAAGLPLDQSRILSFVINPVMNLWAYTNPDPENAGQEVQNGGARLPSFTLQLRFPSTLENGDVIEILAPPDFYLTDSVTMTDAPGRCRGFRWVGPPGSDDLYTPLPHSNYRCGETNMTIVIEEPAPIPRDFLIEFGLELSNPLRTPSRESNFWRCTLFSVDAVTGARSIKSSKAFQGWMIIPQLEAVDVQLIGANIAAESVSAIRISFTAVSDAEDIAIQVVSPSNFNFDQATVDASDQVIFVTNGALVRIRMTIVADRRYSITLRGVVLGREGGQTDIQLTTWRGGLFQSGTWVPGNKQDERLHFRGGFRLPGLVVVRYDKLENTFHQDPVTYPVQSLWLHQMGRPAYAEFHVHMTRPVVIGGFLSISAKPYEPTSRLFRITEAPQGVIGSSQSTPRRVVRNEVVRVDGGELRTRLLEPLIPYRVYEIVISVIAPHSAQVQAHGAPIRWRIETTDGARLPTNTNDANSREFPIVEEYGFQVSALRAPPDADIEVTLAIQPGLNPPTELRVVAPLLFNFSANCLVYGGNAITACGPGDPMPDGRKTAVLTTREGGIRGTPEDVRLIVRTPEQAPVDKAWFVEGLDVWTEAQLGWGEATGLDVIQMADASVTYPGIPGVLARMVWRFRSQVLIGAGGYLQLSLPAGLSPVCFGEYFEKIALPHSGGCNTRDPTNVLIYLNSTMVPSEYVFAIYVTPPAAPPVRNELSIRLRDRFGQVRDAAIGLPGMPIRHQLKVRALDLHWTSSRPNRPSTITIGFEALDPLPDIIVAPTQQVSEILISLPVGFTHLVDRVTDFTIVNEDMPFAKPPFLDYMQKDRLRITLNLNRTSWTTLKAGSYSFRFSVLIPDPLPIFNVWHVSLCMPNFPGGCTRISDPAVLVTFAMPGFGFNQPPLGGFGVAAQAADRFCTRRMVLTLCIALTWLGSSFAQPLR